MPLDAQMKWVLDQLAAAKTTPFHQMTPEAARAQMASRITKAEPVPSVTSEDRSIPGPGGALEQRAPASLPPALLPRTLGAIAPRERRPSAGGYAADDERGAAAVGQAGS